MIKQRFFKTDVFSMGYSDKWHILEASYMGISSNFGVLYGSVYTLLCRTDFIEKGMTK